jgi:hypothetical protein
MRQHFWSDVRLWRTEEVGSGNCPAFRRWADQILTRNELNWLRFLWFSSAPPCKCHQSNLNFTRGAQIPGTMSPWWPNFAQRHVIFVGMKYEFVSCHPSGTCGFEVTPRFLETMCTPELCLYCFLPHPVPSTPIIQSFNSTGRSYWQHNYTNYNKTQRFNKKKSASKHVCFWHLKACKWHFDLSHLQI